MRNASLSRPTLTRRRALAAGGIAAVAAATPRARSAEPSVIRVAFPAAIATLDPQKMRIGGLDYNYANAVFNRLTRQISLGQVLPDLATSWEPSEDLKTWTFHLRPGVKFHNGKPFEAADVVFTYKRLLDPSVGSVLRASLSAISKVEAIDPHTVKFTLSIPYTDIPAVAAAYQATIVSESMMDTLTTKPIGTGPFRFVSYEPDDQMVLEKNPDYFVPGQPKIDRAVFRIIPEYTTAVAGLQSGAVDIVYDLPPEQQDVLKASHTCHVDAVPSGHWQGIIFNNAFKPYDDPRVREALIKLVDKQKFTDIATFGYGTPTVSPIPPTHPYFRKDLLLPADIPGARKLLAEAGLGNGFPILMYVPESNPNEERIANAFRDVAKEVGITVTLQMEPPDKFYAEMEGKVPFSDDGFYGRATPDLMTYAWYHTGGSWNDTLWHYSNPEMDKVLDTARSTLDKTVQAKMYGIMQEIVAKNGPGCVIYVENFACGVSNKVQGFKSSPLMWVDLRNASISA